MKLKIPPGVYKNGTELQGSGRWIDSNLVRWIENTMQPVGGWRLKSTLHATSVTGTVRRMISWLDDSSNKRVATPWYNTLMVVDVGGTVHDITPTAYNDPTPVIHANKAELLDGFGISTYGTLEYGLPRPDATHYAPATTWALDTWGEYLVACSTTDGKIYEWGLDNTVVAAQITNAPTDCKSIIVTHERFLVALGAGGNGRKVQWSDQENNTLWTAAATNQAGDFELTTEGRIISARRVKGQLLILTDIDAHTATYQGPPYIYGFEKVGDHCGLVSANAVASVNDFAVWMGHQGFYIYDGYTKPLPSEVEDFIYGDINRNQISQVSATVNSQYNEVWWFYPSEGSIECDAYVTWNYVENHWAIGKLDRSAGVDAGIFRYPIMVSPDGSLYEHDIGFDHDSTTPYAETGPMTMGDGVMSASKLISDEATLGDVQVKFKTRMYPTDADTEHGPYTMATPTSVRFTGRQIKMRIEGVRDADWRVGIMDLEVNRRGKR